MGKLANLTVLLLGAVHLGQAASHSPYVQEPLTTPHKRIAIIGAGTGGIGTLRTLVRVLPEELSSGWEVVVFEQRRDIGGVWLPDLNSPRPPELPETPLYGHLRTNGPHPTMTMPHFPFKPYTNLYPHHSLVWQYHQDIVCHWNLSSYFRLNHEVTETRWVGTPEAGRWRVKGQNHGQNESFASDFDHLIVATGHNHYPHEPVILGLDQWKAAAPNRTVVHAIFFRDPADYDNKNVIILGGSGSGRDIANQVVRHANSTYVSLKFEPEDHPQLPFPRLPGLTIKKQIDYFTPHGIVFVDNSTISDVDTVILATGYEYRFPFLTAGGHLDIVSDENEGEEHLTTNLRRLRPLYEHILSLDAAYPLGALYVVGLPIYINSGFNDAALGLFVAYTVAFPHLLASRTELLEHLRADEASQRAAGLDPPYVGHRLVRPGGATVYQDGLVEYLQVRGLAGHPGVPPLGEKFTPPWRTYGMAHGGALRRAWTRVEEAGQGEVRRWLEGVETEEDWADLIARLVEWEQGVEEEEGTSSLLAADEGYVF
ncbi:FAD/NAD-P-binding domain-containing protein [Auriscalpium vulgare]|uniref:FAD/NAD-P-binding domain-containing protein n=1 Tax=Auriscalpium vulgare TaxID=40419 RepID=A0ACB8S2M9_9AGAM|nr:FAD/NAD-P-binding domain-containing protein [Auriscalpium vulgare]